jgi:acetyl/propionyl-CoA carboxylase alpha subunit
MPERQIRKLLIANRGEIALRIIRSARVMGIRTVAVYSEADARSAHVAAADESRLIGAAEAAKSYLNIDAIIGAARDSGADAVHPGYGFLSERAEFARAAEEAGIIFVGPPGQVLAQLGDKIAARKLAAAARVPVVPGVEAIEPSAARDFAARIGLPILVKAAAGGGGRGMRVVESVEDLDAALKTASREAGAAFGDGRVFLERYLARPRHIEVQILGDRHGNLVALGERECSIQRRHQKVIEESPAPGLSESTRAAMIDAALRLARAAQYVNAGTVEFLLDGEQFYFLEVNTRLQVEHPITEIRFGCDLVAEQLKIAMGQKVWAPGAPRGCAIECRVYAEDARQGFRPATGAVVDLRLPAGPGVRFDTHLVAGAEIGAFYDGLLGKLICSGADREQARGRMLAAFDEFAILGVTNTAGFLRDAVASERFARADLSTRFIDELFSDPPHHDRAESDAALIAAALATQAPARGAENGGRTASTRSPWTELGGFELWRRQ